MFLGREQSKGKYKTNWKKISAVSNTQGVLLLSFQGEQLCFVFYALVRLAPKNYPIRIFFLHLGKYLAIYVLDV
jgi:hypothetical protein